MLKNSCNCFGDIFIHNCILRYRGRVLFGTYTCSTCGKVYDIDAKDKNLCIRNGENSFNQVMELLFIEDLSVSQICEKLKTNKADLKKYLVTKIWQ